MPEEMKLSSCPFCGGEAIFAKGVPEDNNSVICTNFPCAAKIGDDGRAKIEVADEWNRRTPEPGTSVVRWVKYDGTAETLPKDESSVMVQIDGEVDSWFKPSNKMLWCYLDNSDSREIQIGDLWARLPEPPEGSHAL